MSDHVRRVCQDYVDAITRYDELVDDRGRVRALSAGMNDAEQAAVGWAAHQAYTRRESARRSFEELTPRQVIDALDSAMKFAALPNSHMSEADVRRAVAMSDRGMSYQAIGRMLGRDESSVFRSVKSWRACTSRVARHARREGRWTPRIVDVIEGGAD